MDKNLGMGVILQILGGNRESAETFQEAIGKTIADLELSKGYDDDYTELLFTFTDGSRVKLYDAGQTCCERRYMHTDDPLHAFIGAELYGAEVRDGPDGEDEYGQLQESEFLIVSTSKGAFTVVNYNEHNGYYGGFAIRATTTD